MNASAISITHTHSQGVGYERVSFDGGNSYEDAYLGRFVMSVASDTTLPANYPVYPYNSADEPSGFHPYSFYSYCLEPTESIGVGHGATYDYTIGPLVGTGGFTALESLWISELFGRYSPLLQYGPNAAATDLYSGGTFRTAAAALQLAIWEINLDAGNGWDLNNGNMRVGSIVTEEGASRSANEVAFHMLNSLTGTGPMALGLEGLRNNRNQDVIIQSVPDGGTTAMLLGMSMLVLGYVRRQVKA